MVKESRTNEMILVKSSRLYAPCKSVTKCVSQRPEETKLWFERAQSRRSEGRITLFQTSSKIKGHKGYDVRRSPSFRKAPRSGGREKGSAVEVHRKVYRTPHCKLRGPNIWRPRRMEETGVIRQLMHASKKGNLGRKKRARFISKENSHGKKRARGVFRQKREKKTEESGIFKKKDGSHQTGQKLGGVGMGTKIE